MNKSLPIQDHVSSPGDCATCNGAGTVKVTVLKECISCYGVGTVYGRPCEKCSGAKPVMEAEEERVCFMCAGTTYAW